LLLNNLSFALATADRVDEARVVFGRIRKADLDPTMRATCLATAGLLSYRAGQIVEGRYLYKTSIETARKASVPATSAWATLFHAREELRAGTGDRPGVLSKAEAAIRDLPPTMHPLAKRILPDLAASGPRPHATTGGEGRLVPVRPLSIGRRIANALLELVSRALRWRRHRADRP